MTETETTDPVGLALALQQAGRLDEAEAAYRAVLAETPDDLDALNLLGLVLQNQGRLSESIALLSQALALDPAFPEAWANLSRAQRAAGDSAAALQSARRATELDPDLADAFILVSRIEIDLGAASGIEAARQAAALAPDSIEAQATLGLALSLDGAWPDAVQAYDAALRLNPDRADVLQNLGAALVEQGDFPGALACFRKAASLTPDDVQVLTGLAVALQRSNEIIESADTCRRAIALAPDRADLWRLLGHNLIATGDFDTASDCYRRSLALDPDSLEARQSLAKIRRMDGDQTEAERLLAITRDEAEPGPDRIKAGFAAGAMLDQAGAYDTAFEAFAIANRLARSERAERGIAFDAAGFARLTDHVVAAFGPDTFAAFAGAGVASEQPVFIVGMPRSGTTLVEQIAASHPHVFGAGELNALPPIAQKLDAGVPQHNPLAWDRRTIHREAVRHLAYLNERGNGAARVTDKLPDNVLLLGQIAVLFPQARIVLCRRDPRDVCLSCFSQHFGDGMAWTSDLADLAMRSCAIDRLIAHWKTVLPLRMLEIAYETLVADLEGESRRLIGFLGLPWDPACLAFHRNERVVLTASNWQVRQPLFTSSLGRWRHYQAHLGPLLVGLGLDPAA